MLHGQNKLIMHEQCMGVFNHDDTIRNVIIRIRSYLSNQFTTKKYKEHSDFHVRMLCLTSIVDKLNNNNKNSSLISEKSDYGVRNCI